MHRIVHRRGPNVRRAFAPALGLTALLVSPPGWAQSQVQPSEAAEIEATEEIVAVLREAAGEFRLSSGDVVQIKFFYNPELEDTIQIRPDGMISMPFIGELKIDGLTVSELRIRLEELYEPIVKEPGITVQVREFAAQKIYVGGEVAVPRVVPLVGDLTVLDAIMEGGGNKLTGSDDKAILIRKNEEGMPVRYQLTLLENKQLTEAGSIPLRPFDVVLVPETGIARVDRWVDQYVRKMIPINFSLGFSYLFGRSAVVIP